MNGPHLLAVAPTPFITVQDTGRRGWQRFGVSAAGAMDIESLAAANALVGNPPDSPALEFAYAGGEWQVNADSCRLAVTGGAFRCRLGDRVLEAWHSATAHRGEPLTIGSAPDVVWGYLAVAGGIALPDQLGSLATHTGSGIGGLHGRAILPGDAVPLAARRAPGGDERALAPRTRCSKPFRVVLGPQDDFFTAEAIELFLSAEFSISPRFDRLGYRLVGPVLDHAKGFNIISDGVVPGCVQVPGDGQPIVLMRDCQPPGGYPKIATVVTADLDRLAQSRAGTVVHFRQVGIVEAQLLRRRLLARMADLPNRLMAAGPRQPTLAGR
jgi:biotin-dependent carboxylase-like uncharacterized protein